MPGGHIIWKFKVLLLIVFIYAPGCKTVQKPREFVEELKNPTSFPELFFPAVENIDEIVKENHLAEDENVKVVPIGDHKNISAHLILIRENAEMDAHYHKTHDAIVYVKKGSGILELSGTRYDIKDGMLFVIPSMSMHWFINTGKETGVFITFFSPPFDGKDVKFFEMSREVVKRKKNIYDKGIKERRKEIVKESGEKRNWFSFRKDSGKGIDLSNEEAGQTGGVTEGVIEEKKILIMTGEEKQKIRDVERKVIEQEKKITKKMILNEKLKVLHNLKKEGLLDQEEYDAKRSEIINESKK